MTYQEVLKEMGIVLEKNLKDELTRKNKINTGNLRDSIKYVVEKNKVSIQMDKYGKWVNQGRNPGKYVPVDALNKWLKQRGIDLKYSFVINRAIKNRGIKATHFIESAVSLTMRDLDNLANDFAESLFDGIKWNE